MSRHRHRRQRDDYYDEYDGEGPRRPPPRRKSGNETLYIALGAAGVVGLIVILIITGSTDDEADIRGALTALQTFFRTCIENNEKEGSKMLVAREILRDQNPRDAKQWSSLPPERRAELEVQAFRWTRGRVVQDLQLMNMEQVNNLLRASEAVPFSGEGRVDFQWKMGLDRWNAMMRQINDVWLLERLDRRDG
jgi:hypothetical protein